MKQLVAFSGGKDSTAMVLRLAELGEQFACLFTPTGNELPELKSHIERVMESIGRELITPPNRSLAEWIEHFEALPNWRQRWCTRLIKIEPCIAYLTAHPGLTLCVGLRADEPEREGIYGGMATYRFPLREWGWAIGDVWAYLRKRRVVIPERTDCALCFGQQLREWWRLWRKHPEEYARGEAFEEKTGHTFRSPQRDTWPTSLKDLRAAFEKGRRPSNEQPTLFDNSGNYVGACRTCTL